MSKFYYKRNEEFKEMKQFDLCNMMGIKCAQCQLIFKPQHIEEHLNTHIQPRYLAPNTEYTGAKKLTGLVNLTEQTLSLNSDIASLNIAGFPSQQRIRKDIKPPSQFAIAAHDLQLNRTDLTSYKFDQNEVRSHLGGEFQRECDERMYLTQNINLNVQSSSINFNPQIVMYRRQPAEGGLKGKTIKRDRKVNSFQDTQTEKSEEYRILSVNSQITQPQHKNEGVVINIKKHRDQPSQYSAIDTSSKKVRPPIQKTHTPSKLSPYSDRNSTLQNTRMHNRFQCEDCQGFYCSTCRSSIPAQYRPWNIKQVDPKIVAFYKQHVYKGNCQSCEKTNY